MSLLTLLLWYGEMCIEHLKGLYKSGTMLEKALYKYNFCQLAEHYIDMGMIQHFSYQIFTML